MECDCIGDVICRHLLWLFGSPDNFLFAVYLLGGVWWTIIVSMLVADIRKAWADATYSMHRRRMEEMDKVIELEKVKAAAQPVMIPPSPAPSPEPPKEVVSEPEPPA